MIEVLSKFSQVFGRRRPILEGIYEFALLYPPQGEKGPYRTATVQSKQTLTQQMLSEALGLSELNPVKVGKTKSRR